MQDQCIWIREWIYGQRSSCYRNTINCSIERTCKTTAHKVLPGFWQPEFFMYKYVLFLNSRQIPVKGHLPGYILCIRIEFEVVDSVVVRDKCSIIFMTIARICYVVTKNISYAKIRIKFWCLIRYEEVSIVINSKDFYVNMI